ncbi:MAG: NrdJb [Xanthomonadales bacterium]|nr:NrdJb [Xanthomonadales bacterium]
MAIKINKKIKAYNVVLPDQAAPAPTPAPAPVIEEPASAEVIHMHEKVERPDQLIGATYKIKSPLVEHALYVTINDIVLNADTEHELRRPFEIFVNSKSMEHFQWIVALTRIMSAVFRKGGDVTFLVEELKAVFDPRGGYFKAGGIYMPSIVAELGAVIERHMKMIGLIHDPEMDPAQRAMIAEKRAAYEARAKKKNSVSAPSTKTSSTTESSSRNDSSSRRTPGSSASASASQSSAKIPSPDLAEDDSAGSFPPGATMCHKCNTNATIVMDGCATCLNCGYSKCG